MILILAVSTWFVKYPADLCGMLQTQLNDSVKEPNISIYFFFRPSLNGDSISDVLFTGGRGVSDFSVLKYY